MSIELGQVYASTQRQDIEHMLRQRRRVERWDGTFVFLRTEDPLGGVGPLSRLRARRTDTGWKIAGHRLVEDAPASCPLADEGDEPCGCEGGERAGCIDEASRA